MSETAKHGNVKIGQKLIDLGADPNNGIETAVRLNHTDLSLALLNANARIDGLMEIAAGTNGNTAVTTKLIEMGGDSNEGIKGAVANRFLEVAGLLIDNEADVSSSDFLLVAINNNDFQITDLLFKSGSDVNYTDASGNNFLHLTASKKESLAVVNVVLTFGLDIEARNNRSQTALHIAARGGKRNVEVTRAILNAGACPNALNSEGKTPRKIAKSTKVKTLIKKYGGEKKAVALACG